MRQANGGPFRSSPLVFVTGPFPPPVHGMAVATERLAIMLGARFTVRRFDIAARNHTGNKLVDIFLLVIQATWTLLIRVPDPREASASRGNCAVGRVCQYVRSR